MRVVGEGAHLVGQFYGGLLCLLAAAAHPRAIDVAIGSITISVHTACGCAAAASRHSRPP
jgi:pimeloyl-ACP methyl ester carboxylesterase